MYRDRQQRNFAGQPRNNATDAERKLWRALRAQQRAGYRFRRQAGIGPYIVNFICFSHKLVIELDGVQHALGQSPVRDAERTARLESREFQVLRFWNHQLDDGVWPVVDAIRVALEKEEAELPPSPVLPAEGREPENKRV
jgi:very-short-patch-repair endonuclease